jgi:hypothetical protein
MKRASAAKAEALIVLLDMLIKECFAHFIAGNCRYASQEGDLETGDSLYPYRVMGRLSYSLHSRLSGPVEDEYRGVDTIRDPA